MGGFLVWYESPHSRDSDYHRFVGDPWGNGDYYISSRTGSLSSKPHAWSLKSLTRPRLSH